ncbi:hypothetical protein RND81_01G209400 [Saponaria officinalis]|uniref:Defensin-like protein n=1 Tax=Saponaria officinalis TaxID=3572 RepID=A0AAW1N8W9_SAPOF
MAHIKFHAVLIFVLLACATAVKGVEEICHDPLGDCGQCDQKCKAKHPGGEGECNNGQCVCTFACDVHEFPPPEPKTCTSNDGACSLSCGDDCCTAMCKTKWSTATGECQQIIGTPNRLCLCSWQC